MATPRIWSPGRPGLPRTVVGSQSSICCVRTKGPDRTQWIQCGCKLCKYKEMSHFWFSKLKSWTKRLNSVYLKEKRVPLPGPLNYLSEVIIGSALLWLRCRESSGVICLLLIPLQLHPWFISVWKQNLNLLSARQKPGKEWASNCVFSGRLVFRDINSEEVPCRLDNRMRHRINEKFNRNNTVEAAVQK